MIQWQIGVRTEHRWKKLWCDLAKHDVAVRHGERAATPITRRTRVRTCRVGTDPQPGTIKVQDRPATGGNRVDAHHGRTHAHACNMGLELAFELARVMRHVSRCSAHVKADHVVKAGQCTAACHAHDATGGSRQDRILATESVRIGQPAARLHEHDPHTGQFTGHLVHIAQQDRRQISIHDSRVAARYELDQRADLV